MRCPGFRSTAARSGALIGLMVLTMPAMAGESNARAISPRQLAHCMIQRLHEDRRGDRSESYKDAFKACREDLTAESDRGSPTAMNTANEQVPSK